MNPLLLKTLPYAAVAIGALLGVWYIHNDGRKVGANEVRMEWAAETAKQAAELQRIAEANQRRVIELQETKNENLITIETLRSDVGTLRKRLHLPKPACPKMPEDSAAGGSIHGTPATGNGTDKTQEAFDRFTEGLGLDAAEHDQVIENCRVVVEWAATLPHN